MAQQYITIAGVQIVQPDEMVGFSFESTYTEDSGRVQSGSAVVSPMYTVEAYALKWSSLTLTEASQILKAGDLVRGKKFAMHYPSAVTGDWTTKQFYVGQGTMSWSRMNMGDELIEGLSFNVIGVEPI